MRLRSGKLKRENVEAGSEVAEKKPKISVKSEHESATNSHSIKPEPKLIAPIAQKVEPDYSLDCLQHDFDGNPFIDLGRNRRASVTSYRGKQMLHIRQYFADKPSKKGIALSRIEWNKLLSIREEIHFEEIPKQFKIKKNVNDLPRKQIDDDGNSYFDIGRNRRVGLSVFKGEMMLNIREYYLDENDEMKPGKRGISLYEEEWKKLMEGRDFLRFND